MYNSGAEEITPYHTFKFKQHPRVILPSIVLKEVENNNKNPGDLWHLGTAYTLDLLA